MALSAEAAFAKPVVLTAPFSANPGDFITLQGSGFGTNPRVYIRPANSTVQTEIPVKQGLDNVIVVRIPKTMAFSLYTLKVYDSAAASSDGTLINAPQVHYFDSPDIAGGFSNRVYGRNLTLTGATPSLTLVDTATNAQLPTQITQSQSFLLTFTPPASIIPGHSYRAVVSNGYGSSTSTATTLGHTAGSDYFRIGQAWAFDYATYNGPGYRAGVAGTKEADHHVFNVRTDVALTKRAVGDGVANDARAIQEALDRASKNGGGIVYLPAGTYNLGTSGIAIRPGVVLQGQSNATTKIIYGPTTDMGPSFSMGATGVPDNGALTGIADLSLKNVDTRSQKLVNFGLRGGVISKFFIQRVNWDLGTGSSIGIQGDRIAILNSNITQAVNYQNGSAATLTGGMGPVGIGPATNVAFTGNSVKWATDQVMMGDVSNVRIEGNHFTRSAADQIIATAAQTSWPYVGKPIAVGDRISRRIGRQMSLNFSKNVFVAGNTFDVSDGTIKINFNDGETLLNESHGRDDTGIVTSASATSISADSKCSGVCTWNYFANNMVAIIVSGKGAGQWRHITAKTNNTFTLDRPLDVIPQAGDHFSIAVPSFENAIINANVMSGNPTGIALWAGMFLNTAVTNNSLTDNAGIYLNPKETTNGYVANSLTFNTAKNVEINYNRIVNNKGTTPAYLHVDLTMISPTTPWGTSIYGLEVRSNQLTAKPGTYPFLYPEGYQNYVSFQGKTPYVENGVSGIVGAVFQANSCRYCTNAFLLNTGALATVIWNMSYTKPSSGSATFLLDPPIANTTKQSSIGTIVGND